MENRPDYEDLGFYATSREQRFRMFASLEFEGQLFMTPYDFIQSVTNEEPRRKFSCALRCGCYYVCSLNATCSLYLIYIISLYMGSVKLPYICTISTGVLKV